MTGPKSARVTQPHGAAGALSPAALYRQLRANEFALFTGVPCSRFGGLLSHASEHGRYVAAANEGSALAIACGAALAGRRSAVLAQNSGLGNLINPLTSLSATYRIPVLLLISLRGDPAGAPDEPQHELMGAATVPVLDLLNVPSWRLPRDEAGAGRAVELASGTLASGQTAALLIADGVIGAGPQGSPPPEPGGALSPVAVIQAIAERLTGELVITTTGYTSRRLFAARHRPGSFYMQGSMGHAISIGLGVALSRPQRRVVVLDGDGACLMHLGSLACIGSQAPENLTHIVLDNGLYESTGGQPTPLTHVKLDEVAGALGYRWHARVSSSASLPDMLGRALESPGPAMLVVDVGPDPSAPPRATAALTPTELRAQFTNQAAIAIEGMQQA